MISTTYTDDPAMPPVTVVVVDGQDYLIIWNASTYPAEGPDLRNVLLNEALRIAQQPTPPSGEVIDFAERVRTRSERLDSSTTSTGTGR